ncbi:MAG: hypothetical protein ACK55I_45635, partial [bacterium]
PVPAPSDSKPQGSAARLIQVAKSQVGYIEGPKDNETKYGAYTKANFQPWCGSFVNWCANEAGVKIPNDPVKAEDAKAVRAMAEKLWEIDIQDQRVAIAVLTQLCDCLV